MIKSLRNILAGTPQAVAETLLLFLSYIKEPVIPFELQDVCIAASNNFENCRQVSFDCIIFKSLKGLYKIIFLTSK